MAKHKRRRNDTLPRRQRPRNRDRTGRTLPWPFSGCLIVCATIALFLSAIVFGVMHGVVR